MSATKEFTMQDVAEHNTSSDIYMVVHDKVYDCTKFLDEHPYVFTPHICSPSRCVAQSYTQVANVNLAVVRRLCSMLPARTPLRLSRMSATVTRPERFSMVSLLVS
jgi:hypothetical protein